MPDDPTGGSEHTVSQGDVSVHRAIGTDGTGVVATVELSSAVDEPVLVEVVEELPDDLPVESTGFKPGAMPDGKELSDDRLRFEQAVADEPEAVVYGLTLSEPVETVAFDAPAIESVEPVAAGATARDDEPLDELSERSLTDTDDPGTGDDEPEPTGVEDTEPATAPEGAADRGRRSVDVRLDRLSARVEEFAAYAESLGALVDDHGTPDEFVDRVASARAELHEAAGTVRDDVTAVDAETDELRHDADSLDDELAALRGDLDEVSASMERVREETATLREELGELQAVRGSLAEAFDGENSVVSDGGTAPSEDPDEGYIPAVTPVDPDD